MLNEHLEEGLQVDATREVAMKAFLRITVFSSVVLLFYIAPSLAQSENSEFVVIANKELAGGSINMAALKGIYLREVRSWGKDGGVITPVDLSNGGSFYQNLFGKSYVQMQAYWLNMRIKYSVDLPVSKKDADSVKQYVADNKGAIGFIKSADVDERVKVLKITN
jgi:ABC-type phosphate transport system substrate-binding protein